MAKQPKTTSEHLISLYGYITGLKREVSQIKNIILNTYMMMWISCMEK